MLHLLAPTRSRSKVASCVAKMSKGKVDKVRHHDLTGVLYEEDKAGQV